MNDVLDRFVLLAKVRVNATRKAHCILYSSDFSLASICIRDLLSLGGHKKSDSSIPPSLWPLRLGTAVSK
jgi:hypothetical protein